MFLLACLMIAVITACVVFLFFMYFFWLRSLKFRDLVMEAASDLQKIIGEVADEIPSSKMAEISSKMDLVRYMQDKLM